MAHESGTIGRWRARVQVLKTDVYALFLAYRDARVPWHAKALVFLVVAYAVSPIDLIPDFIPVLGYLDDLVILPLGILLAVKMIPADVMQDCRRMAATELTGRKTGVMAGAVVVIAVWTAFLTLSVVLALRYCPTINDQLARFLRYAHNLILGISAICRW